MFYVLFMKYRFIFFFFLLVSFLLVRHKLVVLHNACKVLLVLLLPLSLFSVLSFSCLSLSLSLSLPLPSTLYCSCLVVWYDVVLCCVVFVYSSLSNLLVLFCLLLILYFVWSSRLFYAYPVISLSLSSSRVTSRFRQDIKGLMNDLSFGSSPEDTPKNRLTSEKRLDKTRQDRCNDETRPFYVFALLCLLYSSNQRRPKSAPSGHGRVRPSPVIRCLCSCLVLSLSCLGAVLSLSSCRSCTFLVGLVFFVFGVSCCAYL
jgi:hypothetical protein